MPADKLPNLPSTSDIITGSSHNVMSGDMLNYSEEGYEDETWWTVMELEDETSARVYSNDHGYETWTADEVREKLADDEWYHWYLLNRQFVTRDDDDGTPITYAFYTYAIETPLTRNQVGDGKLTYLLWWDELHGVETVDSMPNLSRKGMFPTLSNMYVEVLNPEAAETDDVKALSESYERHDAARKTAESVVETTDHNANLRIQTNEPRILNEQDWTLVDAGPIVNEYDDMDIADVRTFMDRFKALF